jgi:hypothetical protein
MALRRAFNSQTAKPQWANVCAGAIAHREVAAAPGHSILDPHKAKENIE